MTTYMYEYVLTTGVPPVVTMASFYPRTGCTFRQKERVVFVDRATHGEVIIGLDVLESTTGSSQQVLMNWSSQQVSC